MVRYVEYQSLTIFPGGEVREERVVPEVNIFGSPDLIIPFIKPWLHVLANTSGKGYRLTLGNPIIGGDTSVFHDGRDELLVPGEEIIIESDKLTLFMQDGPNIQIVRLVRF